MKFSRPETLSYDYSIVKDGRATKGLIAMIDLPAGTWEIVCTTKECTEDQARRIVERTHPGGFGRSGEEFKNYAQSSPVCFRARDSLHTLLTSKNLDPNKNYIILKKVS